MRGSEYHLSISNLRYIFSTEDTVEGTRERRCLELVTSARPASANSTPAPKRPGNGKARDQRHIESWNYHMRHSRLLLHKRRDVAGCLCKVSACPTHITRLDMQWLRSAM